MKVLIKYWPTLFSIANIMAVYRLFAKYDDIVFNIILGIGALLIVLKLGVILSTHSISKYKFIYIYIFILWLYQIIFGLQHIYPKTWNYLIAKTVILLMIIISIDNFSQFYLKKYIIFISYLSCVLIIFGGFTYPWSLDGRIGLGFGNPNQMASLCAICAIFLIQLDNKYLSLKQRFLLISVLILGVLLSGSRASLGLILLSFIYKYRFNIKLIVFSVVAWVIVFSILPSYQISFEGINRMINTVESQNLSQGRELQREAAWVMINQNPIEGNGIYCDQSDEAKQISELGSHNAYLDFLKWFGYPFGLTLITALLLSALNLFLKYWKCRNLIFRGHLIIIIGVIVISMYEGLIWGINQIDNTIFFISYAVLCHYKNVNKRSIELIETGE